MVENHKILKRRIIQTSVAFIIVLLLLSVGFLTYRYFTPSKVNRYVVGNEYYGFELQTPKNWVAREKTSYSEDRASSFLAECKNDKSDKATVYEIGRFRFEDQKYPEKFGDLGYFPADLPSGVVLEVVVNCLPDTVKNKIGNYDSSDFKVAGEKTIIEFLSLSGFGKTKSLSFLHNNFQYKINEYVYVSPADKEDSEKIRASYADVFSQIISTFKFSK